MGYQIVKGKSSRIMNYFVFVYMIKTKINIQIIITSTYMKTGTMTYTEMTRSFEQNTK